MEAGYFEKGFVFGNRRDHEGRRAFFHVMSPFPKTLGEMLDKFGALPKYDLRVFRITVEYIPRVEFLTRSGGKGKGDDGGSTEIPHHGGRR